MRDTQLITPERAVLGLLALFALSILLVRVRNTDHVSQPRFTDQEQAVLADVEPVLESLLPQERDLAELAMGYEPCQTGVSGGRNYVVSGGEVTDVNDSSIEEYPNAYASFCHPSGAQIGFQILLPGDRGQLSHIEHAYEVLRRGDQDSLDLLTGEKSDKVSGWGRTVDARWLDTAHSGDYSYGHLLTTENGTGDDYHFAWVNFTSGVVMGGLWLVVPTSAEDAAEQAITAARIFDERIRSAAAVEE